MYQMTPHQVQPGESRNDNFLRQRILEEHRSRGEFFRWAVDQKLQKTLVVIGSVSQARFVLANLSFVLQPQAVDSALPCQKGVRFSLCSQNVIAPGFAIAIVADNSMDDGAASSDLAILSVLGIDMNDIENYDSNAIHRLLNGWDYVRAPSFEFTFADILLNLGAVLRGTAPREVIVLNDGSAESAAAALTARLSKVGRITILDIDADVPSSFFRSFTAATASPPPPAGAGR